MTRYFLFVCPNYYPRGGMDDCQGVFDTLDAAKAAAAAAVTDDDYVHVSIAEIGENVVEYWMREDGWICKPFVPDQDQE